MSTWERNYRASPRVRLVVSAAMVLFLGYLGIAASEEPIAPKMSWDGDSYLNAARYLLKTHRPMRLGQRPPLYPAVLALSLSLRGEQGLSAVVILQRVLWLGSGLLIFGLVYILNRKLLTAMLAGCLYYTLC